MVIRFEKTCTTTIAIGRFRALEKCVEGRANGFQARDIFHVRGSCCSPQDDGLEMNNKIHADVLYIFGQLLHG